MARPAETRQCLTCHPPCLRCCNTSLHHAVHLSSAKLSDVQRAHANSRESLMSLYAQETKERKPSKAARARALRSGAKSSAIEA